MRGTNAVKGERGFKPVPDRLRRSIKITLVLTQGEYATLRKRAYASKLTVSDYLRTHSGLPISPEF